MTKEFLAEIGRAHATLLALSLDNQGGYRLRTAHTLVLKHGLALFSPLVLVDTGIIIVSSDRKVMEDISKMMPLRSKEIVSDYYYVNDISPRNVCYRVDFKNRETVSPSINLTRELFEQLVFAIPPKGKYPFEWHNLPVEIQQEFLLEETATTKAA